MGRNTADFHYGHGMGSSPQIGPTLQTLRPPKHRIPSLAGAVMNDYAPDEERSVKISTIQSSQRDVDAKTVKRLAEVPAEEIEPVRLWKDSQGLRLFDGNHRIAAALARGETHIKARIWSNPSR